MSTLLLAAGVAALAVPGDHWAGTWRLAPGSFAQTVSFTPATARGPCKPGTHPYTGTYSGATSGTVVACTVGDFGLHGTLSVGGKAVGAFDVTFDLPLTPAGQVGAPEFAGTYSLNGASRNVRATWHGAAVPAAPAQSAGAQAGAVARAFVQKHAAPCHLTISGATAARQGAGWKVTVRFHLGAHDGVAARDDQADWGVLGAKITPEDELAAEIGAGCP